MNWVTRVSQMVVCLLPGIAVTAWADNSVSGAWQTVTDGSLPPNAVALARDDAGNDEFLCRAFTTGGQHLGRTTRQTSLCHVITDGGEQQIEAFDVLIAAAPAAPEPTSVTTEGPLATPMGAAMRAKRMRVRVDGAVAPRAERSSQIAAAIAAARVTPAADAVAADAAVSAASAQAIHRSDVLLSAIGADRASAAVASAGTPPRSPFCPKEAYAPPTDADVVSVGFDDSTGQPYIDKTAPDGSIWRQLKSGGYIHTQPGQNPTHCSLPQTYSSAQAPLPPELPADGARGRAWIAAHNDLLLAVIRDLVGGNAAILQGIKQAEQGAAEGDLFKQITYRTGIAAFYAGQHR